jgi:MoaA/NifB/PqqE/SkfB family radical SAM enzyme
MGIVRQIGEHELLIDPSGPCDISLGPSLIARLGDKRGLGKSALMKFLARGDQYHPLSLVWEMLDSCNLACPFCYIVGHSNHKIARFREIEPHLADLVDAGLLFCTLTGGEATIHPDFAVIYEFLKMRGVVVEVFSNGHAISDDIVALFVRLPPAEIEISIYTVDDRRFREVYGFRADGGATRVLRNVLRLRDAGLNVTCKTFLNTVTAEDIAKVSEWCAANHIDHYSSSEITRAYDGADLSAYALNLPVATSESTGAANSVCLPCGTKNYGSAINAAFQIYPCPSIRLADCTYDLRTMGVRSALAAMKAFMRKFQDTEIRRGSGSKCASCIANAIPIRNELGEILHFSDPPNLPSQLSA